jgi:predicted PurR-regulated permease PerM
MNVADLAQSLVTFLTPTLGELAVFFTALFFLLISRTELRRSLILLFENREKRLRALRILNDIEVDLTRYLTTGTAINFALELIVAIIAYAVGTI